MRSHCHWYVNQPHPRPMLHTWRNLFETTPIDFTTRNDMVIGDDTRTGQDGPQRVQALANVPTSQGLCWYCKKPLVKRLKERPKQFKKRRYCNQRCSNRACAARAKDVDFMCQILAYRDQNLKQNQISEIVGLPCSTLNRMVRGEGVYGELVIKARKQMKEMKEMQATKKKQVGIDE